MPKGYFRPLNEVHRLVVWLPRSLAEALKFKITGTQDPVQWLIQP